MKMKTLFAYLCILIAMALAGCNSFSQSKYANLDPENVIGQEMIGKTEDELTSMYTDLEKYTFEDGSYKLMRTCTYLDNEATVEYYITDGSISSVFYIVDTQNMQSAYALFTNVYERVNGLLGNRKFGFITVYIDGEPNTEDYTEEAVQAYLDTVYEILTVDIQWTDESLDVLLSAYDFGVFTKFTFGFSQAEQ